MQRFAAVFCKSLKLLKVVPAHQLGQWLVQVFDFIEDLQGGTCLAPYILLRSAAPLASAAPRSSELEGAHKRGRPKPAVTLKLPEPSKLRESRGGIPRASSGKRRSSSYHGGAASRILDHRGWPMSEAV
jgi:hypothetical protein